MLLDDLLERNREFVRGRQSRPLPDPGSIRAVFVACYDPRLDSIVRPALGLSPGEGIVLRTAGALVRPEGDPLRSIALAVYLFGVTEVYVIAHSSCRMREFPSAPFIDAFRARGVARESFGGQDLREWAGAFSDTRSAVAGSVRTLALAPMMPADLVICGLLLDDSSGALEILAAPATVATLRAAPGVVATPDVVATPSPQRISSDLPGAAVAATAAAPLPAESARELSREAELIRGFVQTLETTSGWREDLAKLRLELDRQKNPLARLTLVEKFVRRAAVNARGIAVAFDQLKHEPEALVRLFHRTGRTG